MRKENSDFSTKFISEAGSYLINADYFAFVELKDYACYVIADGIDPDEKKESAKLAVTTVITEFSDAPGMSAGKLRHYLKAAHEALLRETEKDRLEASIVIMLTDYKRVIWGHAGNSRLYWIRNGEIKLSTKDTSLTQRMVDQEEVPLDQVSAHIERNNLYAYLGIPERFSPVISAKRKLEDGDIFILMTRGVWENIGDAELIDAVDGVSKAEDVCTGLEDVILSQRLNTIENYTIASVFVNKVYNNPKAGRYKTILKIGFTVFMALFGIIFSLCMVSYNKNKSKISSMDKAKTATIEKLQDMYMDDAASKLAEAYATAEEMNVRQNSKAGKMVQKIELYHDMIENLNYGRASLANGDFDIADSQFGRAVQKLEDLKETGEDVSSFEDVIVAYKTYTSSIVEGTYNADAGDYDKAKNNFAAAKSAMSVYRTNEATAFSKAADVLLAGCNAQYYVIKGKEYEMTGAQKRKAGDLEGALLDYESARENYLLAQQYDEETAERLISSVETDINNVSKALNNLSSSQRLEKAEGFIAAGDADVRNHDFKAALENYNKAMEQYDQVDAEEVSDLEKRKDSLKEKIDNLDTDPTQELLNAIDCLSKENYASALEALNNAKDLYTARGDKTNVQLIQSYINNVKALMNKQQ